MNIDENIFYLSGDATLATKSLAGIVIKNIWPLMLRIKNNLVSENQVVTEENNIRLRNVYTLCCSQIKKCVVQLLKILKLEFHQYVILQESRQLFLEKLSWCVNRLIAVDKCLNNEHYAENDDDVSVLSTPMYFINWIDHIFELLINLSNIVYRTDYKDNEILSDIWKNEIVDCISTLYISIEELLLSAMTLGKYCLTTDQHIVTARCQVVLRETKTLLSELIDGDYNATCKITTDALKLPIMPSNVNVLIDVLKDVLCVLETNTNTALLALVIHCFCNSSSPIDMLKMHLKNGICNTCCCENSDLVMENCSHIKDFDLYNERLIQIGSFAVSCSSDQNRILTLRSGLASIEALDPHLVPAIMLAPESHHTNILIESWTQEVLEIRDNIFLIVDPAAFIEISKQMQHKILLQIINNNAYNNEDVCSVINIACIVYDFFTVYNKNEPDALIKTETMNVLLRDINKAQLECKIVSNLFATEKDFIYNVKPSKNCSNVTLYQLIKRLKLLHTLVNRINNLFHTKENEELMFADNEDEIENAQNNLTHTVYKKNMNTYVKDSPRKPINNLTRSFFARASATKSMRHNVLSKLTKHLKMKTKREINFSAQLDELINNTQSKTCLEINKNPHSTSTYTGNPMQYLKHNSLTYNFSPSQNRSSLRKAVLNRNYKRPFEIEIPRCDQTFDITNAGNSINLEITEILDQFSDMSVAVSRTRHAIFNATSVTEKQTSNDDKQITKNVMSININNGENSIAKHILKIPVNADTVEICLDGSGASSVSVSSPPSNVTTLDRISDLDLLENRLNSLRMINYETDL